MSITVNHHAALARDTPYDGLGRARIHEDQDGKPRGRRIPTHHLPTRQQTVANDSLGSSAAARLAVSYAASTSLGRPPRVPFSRAALALPALRAELPSSPICCIHRREPKAPSMSAGT